MSAHAYYSLPKLPKLLLILGFNISHCHSCETSSLALYDAAVISEKDTMQLNATFFFPSTHHLKLPVYTYSDKTYMVLKHLAEAKI